MSSSSSLFSFFLSLISISKSGSVRISRFDGIGIALTKIASPLRHPISKISRQNFPNLVPVSSNELTQLFSSTEELTLDELISPIKRSEILAR